MLDADARLSLILLSVNGSGGMLFGYCTGVIAGALPAMEDSYDILAASSTIQGVVTCAIILGALIGAVFGAAVGEIFGKRRAVFLCGAVAVFAALGSALSPWLFLIILFRELLGVTIGISSTVCPVYVAELAPTRFRGSLGVSFQLSICAGIFVSYVVSLVFYYVPGSFRWMLGLCCVPGLLMCVVFFVMPPLPSESPKQLVDLIDNGQASVDSETEKPDAQADAGSGLAAYMLMVRSYPGATFLALMLAVALQLTGINAVLYYAPAIFANAGFEGELAALWATTAIGLWNFVCTFIAVFLVDRLGRRPLLLIGLGLMTASLFLLGFVFLLLTGTVSLVASLLLMLVYIVGFEMGIGCLFWTLLTEIFTPDVQAAGATLMNVVQWSFNIALSASFPALIDLLSQAVVFWIFCVVSGVVMVVLFFKLPETTNKETEQDGNKDSTNNQDSVQVNMVSSFDAEENIFSDSDQEDSTRSFF